MLNMQKIGQMMGRYSERFGDPSGTLVVDYPETARAALTGHPFMRQQSTKRVVYTFERVRGGWERQNEQDPDGLGRADFRSGECALYHLQQGIDHATLRGYLAKEGCILTWNGVRVRMEQLLEDEYQDATVIQFTREEIA